MAVSRRTHSVSWAVLSSICNSASAAAAAAAAASVATTAAGPRRVAHETIAPVRLAR